jgi:hypothetical protein
MGSSTTRHVARGRAFASAIAAASAILGGSEPALASEKDAEAQVRGARAALEDQRYSEALARARGVLAKPDAPARSRAEALEITATVHLIEGRAEKAKEPLAALYDLSPAFELEDPSLPPRVTQAFEEEAKRPHARAVSLYLQTPEARPDGGGSPEIVASGAPASVKLACRPDRAGPSPFQPMPLAKEGDHYRISPLPSAPSPLFCYAVALDADGLLLGRIGRPSNPVELRLPPPPRSPSPAQGAPAAAAAAPNQARGGPPPPDKPGRSIASAWWLWAGLAVVATAAGVTAIAAAAGSSDPAPPLADITATAKGAVWTW